VVFLAPLLLAAALRFPDLASRPMHADEGVNAQKLGTLLEEGSYAYDPAEYHGPTLYYLTLLSAWLRGEGRYVEIDEITLRLVPAVLGVALVAAHFGARSLLGTGGAAIAALLAALSPAMVFYSRYFIHETLLVFFTFGLLLAGHACWRSASVLSALIAGACAGLMVATKETAILALGCMLLALALSGARWAAVPARHALVAVGAMVVVSAALFSSFLRHPAGIVDAMGAYGLYLGRAGAAEHLHPWTYYLGLLLHFPSSGTPFWTEGLIVGLAVAGGAAAWTTKGVAGADPRVLRFLVFYTVLMLGAYSAIPYKTPWCVLGPLHGLVLLGGAGAVFLVGSVRGAARVVLIALLVGAAAHLGWQAHAASFRFAADPRNPYVYAHTGTGVFQIVRRVQELARAHPDSSAMPIQVIGRENLWPLPWYLRGLSRVGWWREVPDSAPNASVILVTPEMEPALVRALYDLPPPGEKELYVSIFDRPVELRPGVEVRGYATNRLWERYLRR
jgi:uncharacterized protein (TIGR03663 family)